MWPTSVHGPTIHSQIEANSRKTQLGYNWKDETGLERVVPVEKGLTYGSRGVVLGRDEHDNVLLKTDVGDVVHLPLSEANKFSVYDESRLPLAEGDQIRITPSLVHDASRRPSGENTRPATGVSRAAAIFGSKRNVCSKTPAFVS